MNPSVAATTYAIKEAPSVGASGAYALISDGNLGGYYVSGYIQKNSGAIKTGMHFTHYSSILTPSWEIAPFNLGVDFDD